MSDTLRTAAQAVVDAYITGKGMRSTIYALRASLAQPEPAPTAAAQWTITAPDGRTFTGDKLLAPFMEANRHQRAIDPSENRRQAVNLLTAVEDEMRQHEADRAKLVDRFLGWKLPATFSPDCGISFKRVYNENSPFGPKNHEPTGTNLFSGEEARAMLDYILDCDEGDRELGRRDNMLNGLSEPETAPSASVAGLEQASSAPGKHDGPWSVFNGGGACIIEDVTYELAADYMTADRMARGWTMVAVIKDQHGLDSCRPASISQASMEPVAYLWPSGAIHRHRIDPLSEPEIAGREVPLYTHPAPPASASTASHRCTNSVGDSCERLVCEEGCQYAHLASPSPTPASDQTTFITPQESDRLRGAHGIQHPADGAEGGNRG